MIKTPLKQFHNYSIYWGNKYLWGIEPTSLFNTIEIETYNKCNGTCSFCPINSNVDPRKHIKMPDKLFYKIIDELKELGYNGEVNLFSNNEPLLDERIIKFTKYARTLDKARLVLFTNGTLLNIIYLDNLMKYLDRLVINDYSDGKDNHITLIKEYLKKNNYYDKRVILNNRKRNDILTSRGGQAPNKKKRETPYIYCSLPFRQMVIRSSGEVSQCCNDALGIRIMGDANTENLYDIWHNRQYRILREYMYQQGRKSIPLCRYCDTYV